MRSAYYLLSMSLCAHSYPLSHLTPTHPLTNDSHSHSFTFLYHSFSSSSYPFLTLLSNTSEQHGVGQSQSKQIKVKHTGESVRNMIAVLPLLTTFLYFLLSPSPFSLALFFLWCRLVVCVLFLFHSALSYSTLCCPTVPILSCSMLSYSITSSPTSSYQTFSYHILTCVTLSLRTLCLKSDTTG